MYFDFFFTSWKETLSSCLSSYCTATNRSNELGETGRVPACHLILCYNTAQNMKWIWWNRKGSEKRIGHPACHLIALICQTSLSSHTRLLFGDTHILLLIPKMKNRKKIVKKICHNYFALSNQDAPITRLLFGDKHI